MPIANQVLKIVDLERSRQALFTYLNHCLFEVCMKIGGVPWSIDDLPYFYEASMILSYYATEDNIAMVSSYNSKGTRLYSQIGSLRAGSEKLDTDEALEDAISLRLRI